MDKAAFEMVAYKDFIESKKLAFGAVLLEFALISDVAPRDVSLKRCLKLKVPIPSNKITVHAQDLPAVYVLFSFFELSAFL